MSGLLDERAAREVAAGCGWSPAEFARRYLEEAYKLASAIGAALDGGDADEAARLAHGWTGASGTAGIRGVEELASGVERAAREERVEEARDLLARARALLPRVERELRALDS